MLTVNLSSVNVEQRTVSVIAGGAVIALINAHREKNIQESVVRYIEGSVLFYCNIICASYHTVMHFYALCKMRRCSESLESKSCEIVMMQSTFVIEMNLSWKMLLCLITRLKFSIR
ncbi:hypothetical protein Tsp_11822 [Trichinella spiralis]|uniref:hypothetical protein n=1 Tax=Trichinella spiralis TaxID=6334 RepID=UPI0001EFDF73|nr:hypothetical protein Tsp_11822 [Trichinella spiralis]